MSDRPPSLKPLELGERSLLGRRPHHGGTKGAAGHGKRKSLSEPCSCRQPDPLVPLRLKPVVLRESPTPYDDAPLTDAWNATRSRARSDSTQGLLPSTMGSGLYRSQRETPFQRCMQRSSTFWPLGSEDDANRTTLAQDTVRQPHPPRSRRSSSGSLRRRPGDTRGPFDTARPPGERMRPQRKHSLQSLRKPYAESGDLELDNEVLELNTIVEERRAEAAREDSPGQQSGNIERVRPRSETLNAIGSAFSRPLTAPDLHRADSVLDTISPRQRIRRSTSSSTREGSRVSGWLSGLFTSSSMANAADVEPFYKCQPQPRQVRRSHSIASLRTWDVEADTPSLTAASSPTSKGHSRSQTAESRTTSMLPFPAYTEIGNASDNQKSEDEWSVDMTPTDQVGLAI